MKPFLLLPLFAAASLLTSCQTRFRPAPSEPSAKPGINAEFLKQDLNLPQWVERFEKEGREIYDRRKEIVAAARVRPGMSIADIGAGTGLFTPMLAQAAGPRGRVYAVDIAPKFLEHIRERAAAAGLKNIQTVLCTERSVELPPNSVDLAFICDVYHHFEYPQSSLASLRKALRNRGEILLVDFKRVPGVSSDWTMNHIRAGQEVFTAEIEAAGFKKVEEIPLLKDNYILRFRK